MYYLMSVASDESGDGNGAFYLPGGELMPQNVLDECLEFSEKVDIHFYPLSKLYENIRHIPIKSTSPVPSTMLLSANIFVIFPDSLNVNLTHGQYGHGK